MAKKHENSKAEQAGMAATATVTTEADASPDRQGTEPSAPQQAPNDADPNPAHQPHHQWAQQHLPPGYAIDSATGRVVLLTPPPQQAFFQTPLMQQPLYAAPPPPGVVFVPAETPEQAAERQAMEQQRHGLIIQSFERFLQGEATVSDVVKTLYTNTAQHDQLWKGVLVGAAATVLLTSKPVREAMKKTIGTILPGFKPQQQSPGANPAAAASSTTGNKE